MKPFVIATTAFLLPLLATPPLLAQSAGSADNNCILAGRLNADASWAPRFAHLDLLDADGRIVQAGSKDALAQVKQVRIKSPAWLSSCNLGTAIAKGTDGDVRPHTQAPALKAGETPIAVQTISMLPMSLGGHWVELQVAPTPERVTMLASKRPK